MSDQCSQARIETQIGRLEASVREERQERRGLETRASAGVAASMAAVALTVNAAASDLARAGATEISLLSLGGSLVALGMVLSTISVIGGSTLAIQITQLAAKFAADAAPLLGPFNVLFALKASRSRSRAGIAFTDLGLYFRNSAGLSPEEREEAQQRLQSLTELIAPRTVRALVQLEDSRERERCRAAEPEWPHISFAEDLEIQALYLAQQVQRLERENGAAVSVLRFASGVLMMGIFVMLAGVVVLVGSN